MYTAGNKASAVRKLVGSEPRMCTSPCLSSQNLPFFIHVLGAEYSKLDLPARFRFATSVTSFYPCVRRRRPAQACRPQVTSLDAWLTEEVDGIRTIASASPVLSGSSLLAKQ
ncbi:hypothetical protein CSUI_007870 [Cystoisospora suis]|uniref:Uncharacterized protein n=1 Tax=Cystoisospora suis TaxID=483139 RepID=A0A2C6JSB1_9APIC|nr:hypothetical protein CSUI_007870 [Cystoisospora suis]